MSTAHAVSTSAAPLRATAAVAVTSIRFGLKKLMVPLLMLFGILLVCRHAAH
jgi:hypothetical protein